MPDDRLYLSKQDMTAGMASSGPRGYRGDTVSQVIGPAWSQLVIAGPATSLDHNNLGYNFWQNNAIRTNPAIQAAQYDSQNWNHDLRFDFTVTRPDPQPTILSLVSGVLKGLTGTNESNTSILRLLIRIGGVDSTLSDTRMIVSGENKVSFTFGCWFSQNWVSNGATVWLSTNGGNLTLTRKGILMMRV